MSVRPRSTLGEKATAWREAGLTRDLEGEEERANVEGQCRRALSINIVTLHGSPTGNRGGWEGQGHL